MSNSIARGRLANRSACAVLALLYACSGHPLSHAVEAGASEDDGVGADAASGRETSEDAEGSAAASPDAGATEDASRPNDGGTANGTAPEGGALAMLQIVAPGRSRISVWGRKVCALNEQRDVVCWGTDGSSPPSSGSPLHGPFRSVRLCFDHFARAVCAISDDGTLTCAGWQGGASGYLDDPQECRPPITAAAFSCGGLDIAVLDPQGAVARLTDLCDLYPEGRDAGPYDRVEMVDDDVCAIDRAHKLRCFASQLLPDGGIAPDDPVIDDAYIDLALGEIATCGVTREGRVRCWDYFGVETVGKDSFATTASSRGVKVARLAGDPDGRGVLCALFEDGSVGCSTSFDRAALRIVQKDKPWIEIAVDGETLCGVRSDRSVDCRSVYANCNDASCMALAQAIAPPDALRVPE